MARSTIPLDIRRGASDTRHMARAELNLAPRTVGRARAPLVVEFVRELTPSDLALLASKREVTLTPVPTALKLRERHHALARCLAQGMTNTEAAAITGYEPNWISVLKRSPSFLALIEDYRSIEDGLQADFMERTTTLTLTAINRLQDALEDDASPMPASMVLEVAKFGADRTGHAPVQKTFNVNANVDLGSRMSAARARLAQLVEGKKVGSADS